MCAECLRMAGQRLSLASTVWMSQDVMQDPQAFINDMASIFDGLDLTDIAAHTSEIMQSMMEKIRNHQVNN